jgi:hypothetical protein
MTNATQSTCIQKCAVDQSRGSRFVSITRKEPLSPSPPWPPIKCSQAHCFEFITTSGHFRQKHLHLKHVHYQSLQRCSQCGLPSHLTLRNPTLSNLECDSEIHLRLQQAFHFQRALQPQTSPIVAAANVALQEASEPFNTYDDEMRHMWIKRA